MLYTSRKVHADCPVLLDLGHRQGAYLRWLSFNGKGFARCGARLPVNLSHLTISWATASRAAEGDARASGEFRAVLVEELGPSSSGSRPSPGSRRPSRPTSGQLTAPDASITTAGCSRRPPVPAIPSTRSSCRRRGAFTLSCSAGSYPRPVATEGDTTTPCIGEAAVWLCPLPARRRPPHYLLRWAVRPGSISDCQTTPSSS